MNTTILLRNSLTHTLYRYVKKFLATAFKILCYCVLTKFSVNLIYLSKLHDYLHTFYSNLQLKIYYMIKKVLSYCVQNSLLLGTKFFVNLIHLSKSDDYIPFTVIENVHFPTLPLTSVAWIETLVLPILNFISLWSTGMLDIAGGMPELSESTD